MENNALEYGRLYGKMFFCLVFSLFFLSCISFASAASSSATRSMPATYLPGIPIAVSIDVILGSSDCGGAVVETIPAGWSVNANSTFGSGDGYYNTLLNTITWAPIDGMGCGAHYPIIL
jgi:hypothetical protein